VSVRTGIGYDAHAFAAGRPLILGGVDIPHEQGLIGHSDADVLTHAIIDALLGAAGLGDIGQHFPDTDPRHAGADSLAMLRTVVVLLEQHGFTVDHVDSTVVIERPKLAPYRGAMQKGIANALGVAVAGVNVKATTGEGMGFVGRGEGAAAMAVVTLTLEDQRPRAIS
jgi:2-C-methyl-D-erythritol 2,4-cyclodiphosphate synthase